MALIKSKSIPGELAGASEAMGAPTGIPITVKFSQKINNKIYKKRLVWPIGAIYMSKWFLVNRSTKY